jgi:SAUR family protein
VYVGPERVRFVVRAVYASHPLFRRLLDDAEREYGHAVRGPLALPCDVDAFLDVLWHMEHGHGADDDGDEVRTAVSSSPICGLRSFSKNRAAGYRMMNPRSSPVVARSQRN